MLTFDAQLRRVVMLAQQSQSLRDELDRLRAQLADLRRYLDRLQDPDA